MSAIADPTIDSRPYDQRYPELVEYLPAFRAAYPNFGSECNDHRLIHMLISFSSNHVLRRVTMRHQKVAPETLWEGLRKLYTMKPFIDNRLKYELDVSDGWMDRAMADDVEWLEKHQEPVLTAG